MFSFRTSHLQLALYTVVLAIVLGCTCAPSASHNMPHILSVILCKFFYDPMIVMMSTHNCVQLTVLLRTLCPTYEVLSGADTETSSHRWESAQPELARRCGLLRAELYRPLGGMPRPPISRWCSSRTCGRRGGFCSWPFLDGGESGWLWCCNGSGMAPTALLPAVWLPLEAVFSAHEVVALFSRSDRGRGMIQV